MYGAQGGGIYGNPGLGGRVQTTLNVTPEKYLTFTLVDKTAAPKAVGMEVDLPHEDATASADKVVVVLQISAPEVLPSTTAL